MMKRLLHPTSIRTKLTLYLLAVFLVLSLLHWRTYYAALGDRQRLTQAAREQDNTDAAQLSALAIDTLIRGAARDQIAAAQCLLNHSRTAASRSRYLAAVRKSNPASLSYSFLSPSGTVIAGSETRYVGRDLSDQEDVRAAMLGRSPVLSDFTRALDISSVSGSRRSRCFTLTSAVKRGDTLKGMVRTEISVDALSKLALSKTIKGGSALILDSKGHGFYLSNPLGLQGPPPDIKLMPFVQTALSRKRPISRLFENARNSPFGPGHGKLAACAAPAGVGRWIVVAARPVDRGFESVGAYFTRGFYMSLLYTAALFVLFWWHCGIWLTGKLSRLARGATALAVGDLGKRISVNSGDELQSLADSFNRMAESIETRERLLRGKSETLQGLLDVSQVVTSSLDLRTVVAAILQSVHRRFGARAAAVYRHEQDRNTLEMLGCRGFDLDSGQTPPAAWEAAALRAHKRRSTDVDGSDSSSEFIVTAPLVAGDRPAGVLVAAFSTDGMAEDSSRAELLDLLNAFGSHAAVALQNAGAYARAEEYSQSLTAWLDELSALRYVTEAITASLDLHEVMQTLARLTSDVMRAGSCAILLMDAGGELIVGEAHEMSPVMRRLCACRIGEPLSGLAAAEKRPMHCRDLTEEYPHLKLTTRAAAEGMRAFLSVPLIFGKEVLGTIDIWMAGPQDFTAYQVDLLSSIAAHAAMVIQNARLFGKEYRIAETLQSVILENIPNELGNLELGCKYVAAFDEALVGGDFYDVVSLPGGKVGVVIADVSGKGLEAAMHTAMCKYMLRGFAYHTWDAPARTLHLLNQAVVGYGASRFFVTIFYCVIDPVTGEMTYANAGHPPPIWMTDDGLRHVLLYQTGVPIGLDEEAVYQEKRVKLDPDDLVILYTDGIMDARRGADTLGIEGLQEILFSAAEERDPKALVEHVYTEALRYAEQAVRDDIAVIAVRAREIGVAAQPVEELNSARILPETW